MKVLVLLLLFLPTTVFACSPPLVFREFTCPPFDYDEKPKLKNKSKREPIYKKPFGFEAQALIKKIKDLELEQNKQLVEEMINKAVIKYQNM